MSAPMSRILIAETARRLALTDEGVRGLVDRGLLPCERIGARGMRVFDVAQVDIVAGARAARLAARSAR